jgi:DNA (cytosine-5)-methyltransferase 1
MEKYTKNTKETLIKICDERNIKYFKSWSKNKFCELIIEDDDNKPENIVMEVREPENIVMEVREPENIVMEVREPENIVMKTGDPQKFIDLFCGIGGFHQALKKYNPKYECVMACDIDKECQFIYEKNYKIKVEKDIKKIDEKTIPDFDILCAGFPCQPFSSSGKKGSLNDVRGNLFEEILRIANHKKPQFLFLENVKHIKKIDNGDTFKHILKRINECGYYVKDEETVFEISPHQLGIPQHRERVIFVCIRNDLYDKNKKINVFPLPECPINIDMILEKNADPKYRISQETEEILTIWNETIQFVEEGESLSPTIMSNEFYIHNNYPTDENYEEFKETDEWNLWPAWKKDYVTKNRPLYFKYKEKWDEWYQKYQTILKRREINGKLEWQVGKRKSEDSIWNYFIQMRQSGIRVKKCDYFPALVAIVQTPIYAKEKRYITPRECARLQSFPDDFIMSENDHTAYKQFGNSVNVNVIHYVIEKTLNAYSV